MSETLIRIRAAQENERGPLYMEPAVAALHSLLGSQGDLSLEVGLGKNGKIGFFVRGSDRGVRLAESQLYAQYPDGDIEQLYEDPFTLKDGEEVVTAELTLDDAEVYPIKRHPQFDDLLTRANVDPIAGITSALARYPAPGMRAHVQVCLRPIGSSFRRRALRFLPLLGRGFSTISGNYRNFFAYVQLARGWRRVVFLPITIFMGGFRAWPGFNKYFTNPITITGEIITSADPDEEEQQRASS
ncbi:MAG: hypothetical protein WCX61_02195, partial [Candidatus Peribacteraceae bacterium]